MICQFENRPGGSIDLRELAVNVYSVEARDKVNQDVVDALGHLLQKSLGNNIVGRILRKVDGDEKLLGFFVYIANIDTTLVCEENPVALDSGC